MQYKKGDIIKIEGRLGFLYNPEMEVLETKKGMLKLRPKGSGDGGILSHLNDSWHGLETIKHKINE